jgi:hypothetical protein
MKIMNFVLAPYTPVLLKEEKTLAQVMGSESIEVGRGGVLHATYKLFELDPLTGELQDYLFTVRSQDDIIELDGPTFGKLRSLAAQIASLREAAKTRTHPKMDFRPALNFVRMAKEREYGTIIGKLTEGV